MTLISHSNVINVPASSRVETLLRISLFFLLFFFWSFFLRRQDYDNDMVGEKSIRIVKLIIVDTR